MPKSFFNALHLLPVALFLAGADATATRTLTVTNIAYSQPFSPFFFMVHNKDAEFLYRFGEKSSAQLQDLAENGSPEALVQLFDGAPGVKLAKSVTSEVGPLLPGKSLEIEYEIDPEYPLVTLAAMFVNSNDGIVSLNRVRPRVGETIFSFGVDAGTEINNELCSSIPGPACPGNSTNTPDGAGEGFVHVHRGVHGINDVGGIEDSSQDWRNPMMQVKVSKGKNKRF